LLPLLDREREAFLWVGPWVEPELVRSSVCFEFEHASLNKREVRHPVEHGPVYAGKWDPPVAHLDPVAEHLEEAAPRSHPVGGVTGYTCLAVAPLRQAFVDGRFQSLKAVEHCGASAAPGDWAFRESSVGAAGEQRQEPSARRRLRARVRTPFKRRCPDATLQLDGR